MPETGFHTTPLENELYYRLGGRVALAGAASLYYFEKGAILQGIMQQLKYDAAPQLGHFLGKVYGEKLQGSPLLADITTIVPVPLHRRKEIQRGYNQSARLAAGLSESLQLPVEPERLRRVKFTAAQARKKGQARWENVQDAFIAGDGRPTGILLVDDVITTGATIVACAQALWAGPQPPTQITAISIAMARQG